MTHPHYKQPKGLYLLSFTELWERFGFYVLQTLIILYLSKGLGYKDHESYVLYGTFSAMIYLAPVIGGYIADTFIGFRRAILWGGFLLVGGYSLLMIPFKEIFFLGLSFIIIGNGFFKPNISATLGELYSDFHDPRRDGGFTLFYMGITLGSLLPPLFIGYFVAKFGWHLGYGFAACGMLIGVFTFLFGKKILGDVGGIPKKSLLYHQNEALFDVILFFLILIGVVLFDLVFRFPFIAILLLILVSIVVLLSLVYFLTKEQKQVRNHLLAALILIFISIGFWSLYNQTFTSLMLYADRNMIHSFLGIPINAEFTQFFNPLFIIILSPILNRLWIGLHHKQKNPSTPTKFSFGALFMALGFLVLGFGGEFFAERGQTSSWWLVFSYFLQTIGELLLSPIGLAMITRLSPRHLRGMMMGVWFLSQAAAFAIGGILATLSDIPYKANIQEALHIYDHAFYIYGSIALALAILSFFLVPFLKRLIHGPDAEHTIK